MSRSATMAASGPGRVRWLRDRSGRLDPVTVLTCATLLGICVLYIPGLLPLSVLRELADYHLPPLLLFLVVLAIGHGLPGVRSTAQRHFWMRLASAFAFWLAADLIFAVSPKRPIGTPLEVLADVLYFCFYLLFLLAVEQQAHLGGEEGERLRLRRFTVAGMVVASAGLLSYFLLIPLWLVQPEYATKVPSFLLFAALDVLLALRLVVLWWQCRASPWRWIYGPLAVAMMLWTVFDAIDGLYYAGLLPLESGSWWDLLWYAPFLLSILATRMRNRHPGGVIPVSSPLIARSRDRALPEQMIAYTFVLPVVHFAIYVLGWAEPETRLARDLVVLLGLLTLGSLAVAHELGIRGRNRRLRRRLDDLLAGERLESAQRLESLGVLAGGIAHDFNNLLVAILGNADLVLREPGLSPTARERVGQLRQAALQAADLAGQMLTYAGRGEFRLEPQDLNELARDTVHLLESVISKKAELSCEWAPELPAVAVDAVQIRQLIMNLITNASEALDGKPGRISLSTGVVTVDRATLSRMQLGSDREPGRYVALTVSDTGRGMTERTRQRMFDPFFSTKFTGRGLGLAAVLGIVRSHGAALGVESEVGVGTSACVLLPLARLEASAESPGEADDSWPAGSPGAALVVEDAVEVQTVLRSMLEVLGFEVITTSDGREGLAALAANREKIRIVLLDLTMPVMDGAEALAEIQQLAPELPVVIMSGYDDENARRRCAGLAPAAFLRKPFRLDELRASLRQVLVRRAGGG